MNEQAGQCRCADMPNDAPEGHYWAWVQSPGSIPSHFRQCKLCGRIDASEAITERERLARIDQVHKDLGGLPLQMPMKSLRTNNTAFRKYAIKFFNDKIKERRERQLSALQQQSSSNPAVRGRMTKPVQEMFSELRQNLHETQPSRATTEQWNRIFELQDAMLVGATRTLLEHLLSLPELQPWKHPNGKVIVNDLSTCMSCSNQDEGYVENQLIDEIKAVLQRELGTEPNAKN